MMTSIQYSLQQSKVQLTNRTQVSQQLCPHAKYHVQGGLGQEVTLTEGPLPTISAGVLPCLKHMMKNILR